MKSILITKNQSGFSLLEMMVCVAIMGALASIAIPHYIAYRQKAFSVACEANRDTIENHETNYYVMHNQPDLETDNIASCPAGGIYVWLVSDPEDPRYPILGCSLHGFGIPAQPDDDSNRLFYSDLSSLDDLTPLMGDWANDNGDLTPSKWGGEHRLGFGKNDWQDYEISVNASISDGKGYGIYYRADGKENITGYCFQYDPGYGSGAFLVRKVFSGGERGPFQRLWMPDGFPTYNQSHNIKITVEGDHHVIKLDGETLMDFHDDEFAAGSGGFRTWGGSDVAFEDVLVSEI